MQIDQITYLDYQATTPVDKKVLETMLPFFSENFANPSSSDHFLGWQANKAYLESQNKIADFFNADPDQIIFTSGATEANNQIIASIGKEFDIKNLVFCPTDHKSTIEPIKAFSQNKKLTALNTNLEGFIDLCHLEKVLKTGRSLVSVCVVNNEIGTIQPYDEISKIVHQYNSLIHFDATQAPCTLDLSELLEFSDFTSLSAHKIYGPKGVGCLAFQKEMKGLLKPLIIGGAQQDYLRAGTIPLPLCVGLAKAIELMQEKEPEKSRIEELRGLLFHELKDRFDFIELNGPLFEKRHPGNLNLRFNGYDARELLALMQPRIAASMGSACNSGIPEPSYVLREIGLSREQAQSSIRFSLGRFTDKDQIFKAIEVIEEALKSLKKN